MVTNKSIPFWKSNLVQYVETASSIYADSFFRPGHACAAMQVILTPSKIKSEGRSSESKEQIKENSRLSLIESVHLHYVMLLHYSCP